MAQKKSKERREEPLGKMSYQISSKRSLPFWLLIGARKLQQQQIILLALQILIVIKITFEHFLL